ncbi:flagellar biosynthetic protein FliP [Iodidimonas nitroreducens]|uniref:Flagellar biosynthetic protein FliP n=2 Tax=Iodidimonas nitroreducens TaxID=1236968 RepID=A0A5A7N5F4_9PROT|nr:flagellar type III secretion system pore protein FliP [Iodidimonas nitroreducens]GAK34319.1 flagellar biosynthetic protein FliP [alpha proteobacterium Q-1]GER03552.1 flagellar biosynthetic protein FliP [Iodidimonas nitroreducens]
MMARRTLFTPLRVATLFTAAFIWLVSNSPVLAQSLSVDLGPDGTLTGRVVQLLLLITVLSLAPSILIVMTSFTRIIIVLSLLRSALGTQQTPPNVVLISLALFLTGFIMAPTLQAAWQQGIEPLINEEIEPAEALPAATAPFRTFMLANTREKDLQLFVDAASANQPETADEIPLTSLIPAFVISELKRAFEIGFLIYIPFIVIDLVIASILMSMGMMMLPPVLISLPFKIIFFVLVDGWHLLAGSLMQSFTAS